MQTYYPAIKTYAEHHLETADNHELFIEEAGNPQGIPVLVVHSGPGVGCEPYHRRFFDPEKYRIILFDQRGAGRSTPHAELKGNTTQELIGDMEAIREYLDINRWVLWGGAWGSTLSLLYAEAHPDRVLGLIIHSIFLARQRDIDWYYKNGASQFFPDHWYDFVRLFPEELREEPLRAYFERLTSSDEVTRLATAKAWSLWQARTCALQPHHEVIDHFADPHFAMGLAKIESHYFVNNCFIEENQILRDIDRIKDIPGYIIHGRYNMVSPLDNAWALHQAWPKSELFIIRDAGHSAKEPGIIDANIIATKNMAKITSQSA